MVGPWGWCQVGTHSENYEIISYSAGGFITDKLQAKFGLHSRLWVQSGFLILAAPFAALTLYLKPPYCFIALALYYFFAETWFAILFTVIVEIVPSNTRGLCTGQKYILEFQIIFFLHDQLSSCAS